MLSEIQMKNLRGEMVLKDGTRNLTAGDLHQMESKPSEYANDIGKRLPYHLQYIRDGKVNVKTEDGLYEHRSNV